MDVMFGTHHGGVLTGGDMGGGCESIKSIKGKFSQARYTPQMGCEVPLIKGVENADLRVLRQEAQLLRGDFLDAFARLECAVMQYIGKTDVKASPGQPFSQKLALLQKARDRFRNPKRLDVRVAVAEQIDPPARNRVEIAPPFRSDQPRPLAARDRERRPSLQVLHLGTGVPDRGAGT